MKLNFLVCVCFVRLVSAREELVKMRGQASNKRANEDAMDTNA